MILDILAAGSSNGGLTTFEVLGYIVIPLFVFVCGVLYGGAKWLTRAAQYMTHSEEAQTSIAKSNDEINAKLDSYIDKTNAHLSQHDSEIAVLKYAQQRRNGGAIQIQSPSEAHNAKNA